MNSSCLEDAELISARAFTLFEIKRHYAVRHPEEIREHISQFDNKQREVLHYYYYNNLLLKAPESFWSTYIGTFKDMSEFEDDAILYDIRDEESYHYLQVAEDQTGEFNWGNIKDYRRKMKYNDSFYYQKALRAIKTIHIFYIDNDNEKFDVILEREEEPHFVFYYASNEEALSRFLKVQGNDFLYSGYNFFDVYCRLTGDPYVSCVCHSGAGFGNDFNFEVRTTIRSKLSHANKPKKVERPLVAEGMRCVSEMEFITITGLTEEYYPHYVASFYNK